MKLKPKDVEEEMETTASLKDGKWYAHEAQPLTEEEMDDIDFWKYGIDIFDDYEPLEGL